MAKINSSKPFVITAVLLLFAGSSVGSLWMMSIFGLNVPSFLLHAIPFHDDLQIDGFITFIVMGIGYVIIPRFRNIILPNSKLVYVSYILVICSVIMTFLQNESLSIIEGMLRMCGIAIFAILILYTLRITPKLLQKADYFFGMAVIMFVFVNLIHELFGNFDQSLNYIHLWLLFPVLMIFGVYYKTVPAFVGFTRPRKIPGDISICLGACTCVVTSASIFISHEFLDVLFEVLFFATAITLSISLRVFELYENKMRKFFDAEKLIRYDFTRMHTFTAFVFLFTSFVMSILHYIIPGVFAFYDLGIHLMAIGFIGISIMLYLPMFLPLVIMKMVRFIHFNKIPFLMIISALIIRSVGDFAYPYIHSELYPLQYVFGLSGWLVVSAMLYFAVLVHKSMDKTMVNFKR